jgi:hypothetical protein
MNKKIISDKKQINRISYPSQEVILPSGSSVTISYLSMAMVEEIWEAIKSLPENQKANQLSNLSISYLLRENKEKDFDLFSNEDQAELIKIAVKKWGCEQEYESNEDISNPKERFYKSVNITFEDLTNQLLASSRALLQPMQEFFSQTINIQQGLIPGLEKMAEHINQLSINNLGTYGLIDSFKTQIESLVSFQDIAQNQIDIIGLQNIQSVDPFAKSVHEYLSESISTYKDLMRDILPVEKFLEIPETLRLLPAIEFQNTAIVSSYLLADEKNKSDELTLISEEDTLLTWLESIDPPFRIMVEGAKATIYSNNPERSRHFASSHRELCTLLLHKLAPDRDILKWSKAPELFDGNGKLTRKARLKFICRRIDSDSYKEFFISNFESQVKLLNADEHKLSHNYTNEELEIFHTRFLSSLNFLRVIVNK